MSDGVLEDVGGGRFAIKGRLTYDTAAELLQQSKDKFANHSVIKVDMSEVTQSDSAGLALLLEWVNWAKHYVREIRYFNIPAPIQSIAEISEVDDMLRAGERWTGQFGPGG